MTRQADPDSLPPADEALLQAVSALDPREARRALRAGADPLVLDAHLAPSGGLVHCLIASRSIHSSQLSMDAVAQAREAGNEAMANLSTTLKPGIRDLDERLFGLLRAVLKKSPALPLEIIYESMSPVHLLAHAGQGPALSLLVVSGADPHRASAYGRTAAHWAAAGGHVGVLRRLAGFGVDLGRQDQGGASPAHMAASGGMTLILRELKRLGAPMDLLDKSCLSVSRRLSAVDDIAGQKWMAWERQHAARLRAQRLEKELSVQASIPSSPSRRRF